VLDVAGNNLANLNTIAFKASRTLFSDLLSQTLKEATGGTGGLGGINPQQVGSGVQVASIDREMEQGSLTNTGRPLDLAIEGEGYFAFSNGAEYLYSRAGALAVDSQNYLVAPATGFRVQRAGTMGEAEGFQDPASSDIYIPYDISLPAQATSNIQFTGNLSADTGTPTTTLMRAGLVYSTASGTASSTTLLADLSQASGLVGGDVIDITGTDRAGNAVTSSLIIDPLVTTLGDLVAAISASFPGSTAYLSNGEIYVTDDSPGYSLTEVQLSYTGAGSFDLPAYFSYLSVGGTESRTASIEVYDSQGTGHVLTATFVRQDNPNFWDMVVDSVSSAEQLNNRRVDDIEFGVDGSFQRVASTGMSTASVEVVFGFAPGSPQTVELNFGTAGGFDGLTQFGGASTAAATDQDGYESGSLSSISVNQEGTIVGLFTNGRRKEIARVGLAVFQNPAGLKALGGNYFQASGNSGLPVPTQALSGGAGAIHGGALETSNVDMAREFVQLITAQRGFQANARTITVTDQVLRELANLIR
jgi:flagellar hook protein FlgE